MAKISDFGESVDQQYDVELGKVGTPLFVAPEILRGLPYDTKADVYSYGIVMSELSTHKKPYFQHSKKLNHRQLVGSV